MMRRTGTGFGSVAIVALVLALAAGSAAGAGREKLVVGTVYDTTCATTCVPECPPPPQCGPVTAGRASADVVCAQRQKRIIVCPLQTGAAESSPPICLPESGCVSYPVYAGEGAIVKVRKRGLATVLATLPIVEGHFKLRLDPGEYVFHPYLPEEPCWSGARATVKVTARLKSPVPVTLDVGNRCVAHPDAR